MTQQSSFQRVDQYLRMMGNALSAGTTSDRDRNRMRYRV
jgi:hypothetical protein